MASEIIFDEAEHIYLVDGKEVPSVTTILQPLSNRSYSSVNASVLEYARNRGTAVHEALELYDLGCGLEATPEIEGFIRAYLEWSNIYKPSWKYVEHIVYCESEGFIGTLDRIGTLNGTEFAIVDIKTSQPTKEALVSVCVQTSAYAMAYTEQCKKPAEFMEQIKRYGLFLKADGTFRLVNCEEYEDKYGFTGILVFYNLLTTYKSITRILETKARKR
jgi:hypothetical protein